MSTGSGQGVPRSTTHRERVSAFLGLERNTVAVSGAMFLMGLGEELWKRFIPK